MGALVYAGALATLAVTFLGAAVFFLQVWRHRRRDGEYAIFAVLSLVMAVYAGVVSRLHVALAGGDLETVHGLGDLGVGAAIAYVPLAVHFTLRYVGSVRERRLTIVAYTLMLGFATILALGDWWSSPLRLGRVELWGVTLPVISGASSKWALTFYLAAVVALVAMVGLLWGSYRRGRRESLTAMLGMVALVVSALNDIFSVGLSWYSAPTVVPFGSVALVYGVSLTLVDRYGAHSAAFERRQRELRQRSEELSDALAELEQTQADLVHSEHLAVVGEFATVITHEVRNPMQVVANAVSSLRRIEGVTEDTRTLLSIIDSEMARLERLVSHLLSYARPVVPQRKPLDLRGLLEACTFALDQLPEVQTSLGCAGPWPSIEADADLLRQVFDNLVRNAVQAMDGRGELRVRVAARYLSGIPCVVVGFEDTGDGMSEEQLEQARTPFYTTRAAGTGLGLSIADRIVEAHGGLLHITSDRGVGTAISVILPAKAELTLERFEDEHVALRAPASHSA